jgi:DNA-binding transcriptional ArsR family regulator
MPLYRNLCRAIDVALSGEERKLGKSDCSEPSDGRLPAELSGRLEPELRDALDHPVRREILRTLNGSGRALTSAELAPQLGLLRLSQINYHVQVLAGDGAVVAEGDSPFGGRSYLSDVAREAEVTAVLRTTQESDRARCQAVQTGGPGYPSPEADR